MDEPDFALPRLAPVELVNPYTRIQFNDIIELCLWQVDHIYGVDGLLPSPILRFGATASDFRSFYSRQHGQGNSTSNLPTGVAIRHTEEERPLPDSPTLPSMTPVRRHLEHSQTQVPESQHDSLRDILGMIDELVNDFRFDVNEAEAEDEPAASAALPEDIFSLYPLPLYTNPSFPLPSHPPPSRPLPPVPQQSTINRQVGENKEAHFGTPTPMALSSLATTTFDPNEPDHDTDSASERTITPTTFRRQLVTAPQTREVPMMAARAPDQRDRSERTITPTIFRQQPVTAPVTREAPMPTARAAGRDFDWEPERTITPTEPQRQLAAASRPRERVLAAAQAAGRRDFHFEPEQVTTPTASGQQLVVAPRPHEESMPTLRAAAHRDLGRQPAQTMTPVTYHQRLVTTRPAQESSIPGPRGTLVPRPRAAVERPATAQRMRDVSLLTSRAALGRPAPTPTLGGRSISVSVTSDHAAEGTSLHSQDSEHKPNLPPPRGPPLRQRTLSDLRYNPPGFLSRPPDFSQQPAKGGHQLGAKVRGSPGTDKPSSSTLASAAPRPVTPTPTAAGGDAAVTSRWSPDSSPELSRMKRVRRALSFAKLRPRKSKVFQPQTGTEENGSAASAKKRTSGGSSGSCRSSDKAAR